MTTPALKKKLHKAIETESDEIILEAIYNILNRHRAAMELSPMSEEEFYAGIEKSEKQIRQGMLIDHKDVKKHLRKNR